MLVPSLRRPEIAGADGVALRHQHGAFDRVIELADVAGPAVIEQHLHRRRIEARETFAIALRVLPQKVSREQRNVLAAIAQRRQMHLDRVQAEEQVLPEPAGRHFGVADRHWWPRSGAR